MPMNFSLRFSAYLHVLVLFTFTIAHSTFANATTQLIDSIPKANLPGIKMNSISSLQAIKGTVWITDASDKIYAWQYGQPPKEVQLEDASQRIIHTSLTPDGTFIHTNSNQDQIWVGNTGQWLSLAPKGKLESQISEPVATAWSKQGIIYVAEKGNTRISAFTEQGLFLFSFGNDAALAEHNLQNAAAIGLDRLNRVYVLDTSNNGRILIYSDVGELDTVIGKDEFKLLLEDTPQLAAMTIRPDGVIIFADKRSGSVHVLDWENMKILESFGTVGKGRGQFQRISSLSLDTDNRLYIADQGNQKIEIFKLEADVAPWLQRQADKLSIAHSSVLMAACQVSYIHTAEQMLCLNSEDDTVTIRSHDGVVLQTLNAKFKDPIRAVFDHHEILILDSKDIKVFDTMGQYKFTFGGPGRRDGEFSNARALDISPNAVYIADTGNKRIQVFSRNGLFLRAFGAETLLEPHAISVDQRSNVYVADAKLKRVISFSPSGEILSLLGFKQDHPHEFINIFDVMTDDDNILYIATTTPNNPLSIWLYKDNQLMYRFTPKATTPVAGFDHLWAGPFIKKQGTSLQALLAAAEQAKHTISDLTIDMTQEPIQKLFAAESGFFSHEQWLFNRIVQNESAFALVDLTQHARYTYAIHRAPKQVKSVVIGGDIDVVNLEWLAESKNYSGYYNIYGRSDIAEPFTLRKQTTEANAVFQRSESTASEYRIAAVSAFGKESEKSPVQQDAFFLGLKAFEKAEFTQARPWFEQAVASNPQHAYAYLYLGKVQMHFNLFDDAIQTFQHLMQFADLKSEAFHLQADALMKKRAWLDVKALVDVAEQEKLVDAALYGLAATALMNLDDIPSAIYYLSQAVSLEPASSQWHLALADANFELGATDNAKSELLAATQLAGKDIQAWLAVARAYQTYMMPEDAVACYESALKLEPNHQQAMPELAMLHLGQNNLAASRTIATQMGTVEVLKSTSYFVLGRIALAENNAPQALAMLAKAGQGEPNNAAIWLSMADAYLAMNKPERELEYLNKANAVDTENFDVHIRLAKACHQSGDAVCTSKHFAQASRLRENDSEAHIGLAASLLQTGDLTTAHIHAEKALVITPNDVQAMVVLADIQNQRGMIPDGIATLKKAMAIDNANTHVHLSLAKAYMSNHMYNEAMDIAEKATLLDIRDAAPVFIIGSIYMARQSFDEAISAFQKAVDLAPTHAAYNQQLNMAYLQKKRTADAGGNLLGPKLQDLKFNRVFSAAYKQYADTPVGTLSLTNAAAVDYTNIKISLLVKEYMDFPTTMVVDRLPANGKIDISLLAGFNNHILDIDEDTGVQTEVRAEYYLAGKPHTETLNASLTIYGKNAIVWNNLDMVGSFATPKDDTLTVFIRQMVNAYNPQKGAVNARILKAMTVYNGLSAYGIRYLLDPNTPYDKLAASQLDTVQFPRETLRQRSGDCDDLSILLAASLTNLGIETAVLDVPQHLLMMFNTGVPEAAKDSVSLHDESLAIINGEVWIPLEATLIATSFTEAWAEGARKYHLYNQQGQLKIMMLADAWKTYPPVTLPPADYALTIPDAHMLGNKIDKEWSILSVKALERQVHPYRLMLALDPGNIQAQMQIAVVFGRNGLLEQAIAELENIRQKDENNVAALNNLGNIYFLRQNYAQALDMYNNALNIDTQNSDIMLNIAIVKYKIGDVLAAKMMFDKARLADEQVPQRYKVFALLLKQ